MRGCSLWSSLSLFVLLVFHRWKNWDSMTLVICPWTQNAYIGHGFEMMTFSFLNPALLLHCRFFPEVMWEYYIEMNCISCPLTNGPLLLWPGKTVTPHHAQYPFSIGRQNGGWRTFVKFYFSKGIKPCPYLFHEIEKSLGSRSLDHKPPWKRIMPHTSLYIKHSLWGAHRNSECLTDAQAFFIKMLNWTIHIPIIQGCYVSSSSQSIIIKTITGKHSPNFSGI